MHSTVIMTAAWAHAIHPCNHQTHCQAHTNAYVKRPCSLTTFQFLVPNFARGIQISAGLLNLAVNWVWNFCELILATSSPTRAQSARFVLFTQKIWHTVPGIALCAKIYRLVVKVNFSAITSVLSWFLLCSVRGLATSVFKWTMYFSHFHAVLRLFCNFDKWQ